MCLTLGTLWELIHTKIHTPSVNGNRTAPSALRPQNYSTCSSLLLSSVCSLYWSCVALRRRLTSRLFSHILTECRTLDLCGTWRWVWNCSQHEADEVGFLHLYMSLFGKHWSESVLFVCFFHLVLQSDNAEQGESDSHFLGLVQNLLRDPDERTNFFQVHFGCMLELTQQRWMLNFILLWILCFMSYSCLSCNRYLTFMNLFGFQDVFPGDFGPTYDKAIQTLMWLFLSRLEKLLPSQTLQQVEFQFVTIRFCAFAFDWHKHWLLVSYSLLPFNFFLNTLSV